ncbi:MAG: DUF1028 domain-containing protein [bacterium JZ-2024 1]
MKLLQIALVILTGILLAGEFGRSPPPEPHARLSFGTFSIVAFDPETGDLGVAVASRFLAVGAVVPFAEAGVGAVATQAAGNMALGPHILRLIKHGRTAEEALQEALREDDGREERQVGVVDARQGTATFTGKDTFAWAGGRTGKYYAVQGNILTGYDVVDSMAETYEKTAGPLAERLISALEAGDRAGGDRRGKQSAAILVVREKGGFLGKSDRMIDLRVDDHPDPIPELKRLYGLWEQTFGVSAYLNFADELEKQGKYQPAEKHRTAGLAIIERLTSEKQDDPQILNSAAWELCTHDLELPRALSLAEQAVVLSNRKDASILDTLAECLFRMGRVDEAIRVEEEALALSPESNYLKTQIKRFRKAKGRGS